MWRRPVPWPRSSRPLPKLEQGTVPAIYRIGIGKAQMGHLYGHGRCRRLSPDFPVLIRWIGSDDEEVRAGAQAAMTGARGKDGNVSTPDRDFMTARPTKHQPRRSGGEPEHFMRGRMIVLVGEDAVPPLRRPAVAPEERFESRSRLLGIFAHDDAAVHKNRKNWVVWYPVVGGKKQGFGLHGRSFGLDRFRHVEQHRDRWEGLPSTDLPAPHHDRTATTPEARSRLKELALTVEGEK
jgi:hypothetical protein